VFFYARALPSPWPPFRAFLFQVSVQFVWRHPNTAQYLLPRSQDVGQIITGQLDFIQGGLPLAYHLVQGSGASWGNQGCPRQVQRQGVHVLWRHTVEQRLYFWGQYSLFDLGQYTHRRILYKRNR